MCIYTVYAHVGVYMCIIHVFYTFTCIACSMCCNNMYLIVCFHVLYLLIVCVCRFCMFTYKHALYMYNIMYAEEEAAYVYNMWMYLYLHTRI